jgi:hypothetical protein
MPSTVPYAPSYDFANDTSAQNFVNAAALQTQLQSIAAAQSDLISDLGVSIRDDDTLTDELVRLRNLHPEVSTLLDSLTTGTTLTQALFYYYPVRLASTANIPLLSGNLTVDGATTAPGDRILVKDQTTQSENGLYTAGSSAWTRTADLPDATRTGQGWAVIVVEGSTNSSTVWGIVAGGDASLQPLVGTDAVTFFPVIGQFPLPIVKGGTAASTVAGAKTSLGFAGKYTTVITQTGSATSFGVNHNLNSSAVVVSVVETATNTAVYLDWSPTTANSVTLTFDTAPALSATFTVTVLG